MGELIYVVLTSIGGTTVVVGALSAFLGKIWADRITRKEQHEYDRRFHEISSKYEVQLNLFKAESLRYSDSQFTHYNNLWISLCDLRRAAEDLWAEATSEKVRRFAKQVHETRLQAEKSALVLEEGHYRNLIGLLATFEEFQFGKKHLVELRNRPAATQDVDQYAIRDAIFTNSQHRNAYNIFIEELRKHFKRQLRGGEHG